MLVKFKVPIKLKLQYVRLALSGQEEKIPDICTHITWRGKVIKNTRTTKECFIQEVLPSERLKEILDYMYGGLEANKKLEK